MLKQIIYLSKCVRTLAVAIWVDNFVCGLCSLLTPTFIFINVFLFLVSHKCALLNAPIKYSDICYSFDCFKWNKKEKFLLNKKKIGSQTCSVSQTRSNFHLSEMRNKWAAIWANRRLTTTGKFVLKWRKINCISWRFSDRFEHNRPHFFISIFRLQYMFLSFQLFFLTCGMEW